MTGQRVNLWLILAAVAVGPALAGSARAEKEADDPAPDQELKPRTLTLKVPGKRERTRSTRVDLFIRHHELEEGTTLRVQIEVGTALGGGDITEYVASIVPLDEEGKPHGRQLRYKSARWNERDRSTPYVHGVRHGTEYEYSGWGNKCSIAAEVPWREGEMTGVRKTFDNEGNLLSKTPYAEGKPHGESRTYDHEGRVLSEVGYVEGLKHGRKVDYWPESGEPRRVIPYKEGRAHGEMRQYHLNGELKRSVYCREGLLHGEEVVRSDEGRVVTRRWWLDGEMVSEAEFEVARRQSDAEADAGDEG